MGTTTNKTTDEWRNPDTSSDGHDRWIIWPTVATGAGVFSLILLCGMPGYVSFVLIPLMFVVVPAAVIVLLIVAVRLAKRGLRRKAGSVGLAICLAILLWKPISWTTDYVHLALTVGLGLGQIGSYSASENESFTTYDWSVGLAGGPNTFLIHDPSDEIALPLAQHRHPIASESGFGEECAGRVKHLLGHYYVCVF